MIKNYINLTNGIEALERWYLPNYTFIRIKSTYCEQKAWDSLILELDNDLLMNLALGNECYIFDYSNKHLTPRSIWQGIPFIRYCLSVCWLDKEPKIIVREHNVTNYLRGCYYKLSKRTKAKLKYFKKFLNTDTINLHHISSRTTHDGDYIYYRELIINNT